MKFRKNSFGKRNWQCQLSQFYVLWRWDPKRPRDVGKGREKLRDKAGRGRGQRFARCCLGRKRIRFRKLICVNVSARCSILFSGTLVDYLLRQSTACLVFTGSGVLEDAEYLKWQHCKLISAFWVGVRLVYACEWFLAILCPSGDRLKRQVMTENLRHIEFCDIFIRHFILRLATCSWVKPSGFVPLAKSYPRNRPWRPIGLWDVEGHILLGNRLTCDGNVVSHSRRPLSTPKKLNFCASGINFC
jgi:hypothetical protein